MTRLLHRYGLIDNTHLGDTTLTQTHVFISLRSPRQKQKYTSLKRENNHDHWFPVYMCYDMIDVGSTLVGRFCPAGKLNKLSSDQLNVLQQKQYDHSSIL